MSKNEVFEVELQRLHRQLSNVPIAALGSRDQIISAMKALYTALGASVE